jgi:membrane protein YdbS with pleckstrin-like domain
MVERLKARLLRILRVPAEPAPPAGAPESIRVFRAAKNYFRLSLIEWGIGQAVVLAGLIIGFSLNFFVDLGMSGVALRILEVIGFAVFIVQLPITFLLVRFGYELRWYIVTDRSLRIRYGLLDIREMTLTFANIQQITIRQGPLQRLLGIADLQVRTAGGGSGHPGGEGAAQIGASESMHLGYFRGVDNAEEIRDLMLERLRRWRDSGLGDPDEVHALEEPQSAAPRSTATIEAARQVLTEARSLRKLLTGTV